MTSHASIALCGLTAYALAVTGFSFGWAVYAGDHKERDIATGLYVSALFGAVFTGLGCVGWNSLQLQSRRIVPLNGATAPSTDAINPLMQLATLPRA